MRKQSTDFFFFPSLSLTLALRYSARLTGQLPANSPLVVPRRSIPPRRTLSRPPFSPSAPARQGLPMDELRTLLQDLQGSVRSADRITKLNGKSVS